MRTLKRERGYFLGTHKGCEIEIQRDRDNVYRWFYITVRTHKGEGGYLYDGWSPEGVETIAQAKREACYGAGLDERPGSANAASGEFPSELPNEKQAPVAFEQSKS